MNLTTKKEFVEKLNLRLSEVEIALIVDYKGLNVEEMTQLRNDLRKEGAQLEVVKNTLLSMASEGTSVSVIKEFLKGPNAIVTSTEDPVAPAKALVKFAEDNKKIEIKAGAMNGKVLAVEDIKALAKMPPKEVLLGQLLSTMNAVPTSMVRVLSGVPGAFLNVLNAVKEQKEAA
ncbi:50S ribosomal protein L10 [Desulfamplus magnetovallimortis]|uniref:Large ribosomal subunit protein uL10 n=1 Tax=Desulfamplus magnetovallimortis TaxID=1246637 RepID=A0A1W1H5Z4_9BACT|nr:50S ribosomal protein L10 [Desulfamplus magnetovallimortis]SLM27788.1 50S ribosomal protein L10 [Desulfamplus magnetovallimortis]